MGFKCGIVGLPNVGKSTLFNALTQTAAAQAANYPFCTIEPNVGDVGGAGRAARRARRHRKLGADHPDPAHLRRHRRPGARRLQGRGPRQPVPGQYPRGRRHRPRACAASRTTDITHVEGKIDPIADIETIETELMLADLDSLEKRVAALEKRAKGGDKEAKDTARPRRPRAHLLREGKPARLVERKRRGGAPVPRCSACSPRSPCSTSATWRRPPPTTATPSRQGVRARQGEGAKAVVVSAKIESEIALLAAGGAATITWTRSGLAEPGLNRVIRAGYELLGLMTYFTVGPKEARAWTITSGTRRPRRPA